MNRSKLVESMGIGSVFGVMLFLIVNVALGRSIAPGPRRAHEWIQPPVIDMDPDSLYSTNCAACHQGSGLGMAGQFPPLSGSEWVLGDPETSVRVMLLGLQGSIEVKGQTYDGVMPAQGHLSDEQLALIATNIRSSFENDAPPVEAATVAKVRASLEGRTDPWNGGAELAAQRK